MIMNLDKIVKFDNINGLVHYVPHCIICRKDMQFNMIAHCATDQKSRVTGKTTIPLAVVDDFLESKKPKYNLKIDLNSNEMQGDDKFISLIRHVDFIKYCNTCDLKIFTWNTNMHRQVISTLKLQQESLHYTLKGGRKLRILKWYYTDTINLSIHVDNKRLPDLPFDFDKFVDLDQLNKRINTFLLFH